MNLALRTSALFLDISSYPLDLHSIMVSLFIGRQVAAAIIVISSIVVLAISAHVEDSVRLCCPRTAPLLHIETDIWCNFQIRLFGISTSYYTFSAFVGALTIVVEVGLAITRQFTSGKINTLLNETIASAVLWVFWLGKLPAISASVPRTC